MVDKQDHPAAHSYDWVQAKKSAWDDACQKFGPDSGEAKKAKRRYAKAQQHYLRQTVIPPHLRTHD